MFNISFAFNNVWYLLLLALLPLFWWFSFHSLSGLGKWRRVAALSLRSLVFTLLVFALAEMQYRTKNNSLTVIYLLDQSLSIPENQRTEMISYVNSSVAKYRKELSEDRVGVIVFGKNAEVEYPPVASNSPLGIKIESLVDPDFSNLDKAMQRAMALFPHDAAKRIVIVTDGNQNSGDALRQARHIVDADISIDVVPIHVTERSDIAVEKVIVPAGIRSNQPFELRVVLKHDSPNPNAPDVSGTLRIVRKSGNNEDTIGEFLVTIPAGQKRVYGQREQIEAADFYTYEARFIPKNSKQDSVLQNNKATSFTHVQGKGQVLLIEDWNNRGNFDHLVNQLRKEEIEVTVQPSNQLFTSLPELQRYDCVILADVPRTSGFDASSISSFSDEQIKILVQNTETLGCGLLMIGGENSFGIGGWNNSELEKAMPVNFRIQNPKIVPVGALALMMHAGEIPRGNFWQKQIAKASIKALGDQDFCGLVQWNGTDQWLWGQSKGGMLRVGANRKLMLAQVDRMSIGDMPAFDGSMNMAAKSFARLKGVAIKHMIIISDGDPSAPKKSTMNALIKAGVKVTTVAVGSHGTIGSNMMKNIATQTGGKYHVVRNSKSLPKIYQNEVREISRPLIYENENLQAKIVSNHEMLQGIESFPKLTGYVLTSAKESGLVEVLIRANEPQEAKNSTLLATWTYGLGKATILTTDAGHRWTNAWTNWPQYDQFFSQIVRATMRPTGDTGKYSIATEKRDGQTRVVINALDQEDQFLNNQAITATVLGPDMKPIPMTVQQVAPGRYEGVFDSNDTGSYIVMINPGEGNGMLRTGVNIGYSEEFDFKETNMPLLTALADMKTKKGKVQGKLISLDNPNGPSSQISDDLLYVDTFRHNLPLAVASQDQWPFLLVLACAVFVADIFVRRVQIGWEWLQPVWLFISTHLLRKHAVVDAPVTISRLQSRKDEISKSIDRQRGETKFEWDEEAPPPKSGEDPLAAASGQKSDESNNATKKKTSSDKLSDTDSKTEESYTARLLKAKQDVWKNRDTRK